MRVTLYIKIIHLVEIYINRGGALARSHYRLYEFSSCSAIRTSARAYYIEIAPHFNSSPPLFGDLRKRVSQLRARADVSGSRSTTYIAYNFQVTLISYVQLHSLRVPALFASSRLLSPVLFLHPPPLSSSLFRQ